MTCQWFALCTNPATGTTPHPTLGAVPTCGRCADFAHPRHACHDCAGEGEQVEATRTWDLGYDHAFWTGEPRYLQVCAAHYQARENYEPPDPDGEAFRGGEAAAYQVELAEAARRMK